jgi:hypothetical protein
MSRLGPAINKRMFAQRRAGGESGVRGARCTALTTWLNTRLTCSGVTDLEAITEEIATLYEGTLTCMAITRSPQAALAARRLLEMRLMV